MPHSVLIIEDNPVHREIAARILSEMGLVCHFAEDASECFALCASREFDILVIDRQLGESVDGLSILLRLRERGVISPAIFVTASGDLGDRVAGLEGGADDYLIKPFAPEELQARVRALLRRPRELLKPILRSGPLALDLQKRLASVDGNPIKLTCQDLDLLERFLSHPRRTFSRETLLEMLEANPDTEISAIEHAISRLRRKLMETGMPNPIETVRGVGYRLASLYAGSR